MWDSLERGVKMGEADKWIDMGVKPENIIKCKTVLNITDLEKYTIKELWDLRALIGKEIAYRSNNNIVEAE